VQIIAWSIPGFMLLIAIEAWLARRRGLAVYHIPIALSDIACGITQQLFNVLSFGLAVALYAWVYQFHFFEPSPVGVWLIGTIGVDFLYYWWHRASHEVNILWASHIVHHHSEDYNLAVALRQALLTNLSMIPFLLPLALLGVPPAGLLRRPQAHQHPLPVLDPHRAHRQARPRRARLQHPVAPPGPPRDQPAVPRQELRRHPHPLGPHVRQPSPPRSSARSTAPPSRCAASTRCGPTSTTSGTSPALAATSASRWRDRLHAVDRSRPGGAPEPPPRSRPPPSCSGAPSTASMSPRLPRPRPLHRRPGPPRRPGDHGTC
jgi:hypothetical protein